MLEKILSAVLAAAAFAIATHSAAQPATAQERAALEQERAVLAQERAALERELAIERANAERERALEEAAAARALALEEAAAQRERSLAEVEAQRELALERAVAERQYAQELSRARDEMARAVGDVARLSAQMREPALRTVERNWRRAAGGQGVLGLNVEDSDLGVVVRAVTPNGPAATAGVEIGDTIVSINDVDLARSAQRSPSSSLLGQIGNVVPGDEVRLRLLRDGDYRDLVLQAGENRFRMPSVHIAENGSWPTAAWAPFRYSGAWNDIELVSLTPALGEYFGVDEGLLVVRAGRAEELGFRDGDVIIELAGREPQSPEHALRILASFEPGESLQAAIMRQRRREALPIRVPTAAD